MRIADIRRWQWILIGLVLGGTAGWLRSFNMDRLDYMGGGSLGKIPFEQLLGRKHPQYLLQGVGLRSWEGKTVVALYCDRKLTRPKAKKFSTVFFHVEDDRPYVPVGQLGVLKGQTTVTYTLERDQRVLDLAERLTGTSIDSQPDTLPMVEVLRAANPELFKGVRAAGWRGRLGLESEGDTWAVAMTTLKAGTQVKLTAFTSVRRFLDYLGKEKPELAVRRYRVEWWQSPRVVRTMWMAGGVLLIGGVWPTVINLLVFRRFFRPKGEGLSFWMFWGKRGSSATRSAPARGSADAVPEIAGSMARETAAAGSQGAPQQPEVRKLDAAPLQPPEPQVPKEKKDYAGEFYPTEAHAPPPGKDVR